MKTIIMAIAILLAGTTTIIAQSKKGMHKHHTMGHKYTCPMHPEVVMNKTGKCPKCGMNLVKVKAEKTPKTKDM